MAECLGVVLAGGMSKRMGKNKALLTLDGETMLTKSKQLLANCGVERVVISGEANGGIKDIYPNLGPLAGIASVLYHEKPKAMLILPVDMPLMTSACLTKLIHRGQLSQKPTYFNDSALPLYLPITAFVELFLQQSITAQSVKGPSFKALLNQTNALSIPLKNIEFLTNTNTPEQWLQVEKNMSKIRRNYV